MGIPKRKNNIEIYGNSETELGKDVTVRRQELLDRITKSDTFLPDSIFHDDLDMGMLDYVKSNFIVTTDDGQIPIIPKILTLQRWGEFTNNWEFSDEDGNVKLPFIAVIRKPDVQPGTNPATQRTIPNRQTFYYSSVPTWDGSHMGADVYKIPQPVAVDITFDVTIVCTKFRDLNKFNKIVLQNFSSRQSYTSVKGHYIPIILDNITDTSPMESLDGRRFYVQTYKFIVLGLIIDSDEFEVKPAINRAILMTEFINQKNIQKTSVGNSIDIIIVTFKGDGVTKVYRVGEIITELFYVEINGIIQQQDVDYYHIGRTSKIVFTNPPYAGSNITIAYYRSVDVRNIIVDIHGNILHFANEFYPNNNTSIYHTVNIISDIIYVSINGLIQSEGIGYKKTSYNEITFLSPIYPNSIIGITYSY